MTYHPRSFCGECFTSIR